MVYDSNTLGTSEPTNDPDHITESFLRILPSAAFPIWWSLKLFMSDTSSHEYYQWPRGIPNQLQNKLNQALVIYDLLENRRVNDVTVNSFNSSLLKTNIFHVVVHLFRNGSQMTSKCGRNINDRIALRLVCHFFVLTTFWRYMWSITEQTHSNMESTCYIFHDVSKASLQWWCHSH